jgi:hypothetical protein
MSSSIDIEENNKEQQEREEKEEEIKDIKSEFKDSEQIEKINSNYTSARDKNTQIKALNELEKYGEKGIVAIKYLLSATIDTEIRKYGFDLVKKIRDGI